MGDSRSLHCVYEVFKATLIDDCCWVGVVPCAGCRLPTTCAKATTLPGPQLNQARFRGLWWWGLGFGIGGFSSSYPYSMAL